MSSHCSKYPACGCPPDIGNCYNGSPTGAIAEDEIGLTAPAKPKKETDPEMVKAYEALSASDKVMYDRGYKTFRKRKAGYVLVDNLPWVRGMARTNYTPPKKKRKKRNK